MVKEHIYDDIDEYDKAFNSDARDFYYEYTRSSRSP